jgi:D-inositol-3-phosphate glycosyltransferase
MKNLVARSDEEREDIDRIQAELLLVRQADQVIATGQTDAEYIKTLYNGTPEKIAVLSPGVNLSLFKPRDKDHEKESIHADCDHKLVLFVGRIESLKGVDVLLYAIKILLEKNPGFQVCVWIVGGDVSEETAKWSKELQKLEKIRELLNISTVVKFVGRKKQDELPAYYNASEIVVLPSQYESFGITAVEAMACGVPVITTDVTGVSNLFDKQHSSLITSANNPILLAEKMKNLLVNEKEYKKISHEVYEKVQDLSWENVAEKFIGLCRSCRREKFD